MKLILLVALSVIALVGANINDPELEAYKKQLRDGVDAQEAVTKRDIAYFDKTKLKDSQEQKELKDSLLELAQFRVDIDNAHSIEKLEPVYRNLGYLKVWEPETVKRMEKQLNPPTKF